MKNIVPTALVLTIFFFISGSVAAWATDSHRHRTDQVLSITVYEPCHVVWHDHVVEIRDHRVVASYLRPVYYCGFGRPSEPDPSN
jgi:hypothetical protein